MELQPRKPDTSKIKQPGIGLSFGSSSPSSLPIVYADNIWDIAIAGTPLANVLGNVGSFDQHAINDLFANLLLNGGGGSGGGLVPIVVESLPLIGEFGKLYMILESEESDPKTYSSYVWLGDAYGQISSGTNPTTISWDDITDKPDLAEPMYWRDLKDDLQELQNTNQNN